MFEKAQARDLTKRIRIRERANKPMSSQEEMNIINRAKRYGTVKAVHVFNKSRTSLFYIEYGCSHIIYIHQSGGVFAAMCRPTKRQAINTFRMYEGLLA